MEKSSWRNYAFGSEIQQAYIEGQKGCERPPHFSGCYTCGERYILHGLLGLSFQGMVTGGRAGGELIGKGIWKAASRWSEGYKR